MTSRALIIVLLLVPASFADDDRGILLTREAQRLIAAGLADEALPLLEQARVEWPDSAVVSQTMADAQLALGNWGDALAEYERGSRDGYEHRSRFNSAVTLDRMAETRLDAANVPLDPAGLPGGSQPEMLTAINEAQPVLESARDEFLRALDELPDAAARESIGAVNRRLDDLREMAEELQRRQEEEDQQKEEDEQDQDQDQDQQDQDQEPGDQEQQQDQDQQEGDQEQEQDEPQDGEGDEQQEPQDAEGEPTEPRQLSREEVQQLLEKLEQLEKEGRELRKLREAARRRTVEKDW